MGAETSLWAVVVALVCALMGATGQVFFKLGSASVVMNSRSWLCNWRLLLGAGLYAASAFLFVCALKHGKLSVLYPLIGTSYIWVALFATRFLGESLSILQWLGVLLIVGGIALVAK